MKRRVWLANVAASGLTCAAVKAWPQPRQQPRTVGFLAPPVADGRELFDELRADLQQLGWAEGSRVRYEVRLPGPFDTREATSQRTLALARELVAARVDCIVALSDGAALAAKEATSTIPVVFLVDQTSAIGLVASFAEPGGNLTGMTFHIELLTAKRMQLLKQAGPSVARIAALSMNNARHDALGRNAARAAGLELQLIPALRAEDLERAIATKPEPDGWYIVDYPLFQNNSKRIVELIARTHKPAVYSSNDWVRIGGLMSYSDDREGILRSVARFVDRILRGAKPAQLPVEQPERFVLALNLATARAMGLALPQSLILQADEVIQ